MQWGNTHLHSDSLDSQLSPTEVLLMTFLSFREMLPCLKMAPAWMLESCVLVMWDLLSIYPLIHKMETLAFSCRAHRTVVQFILVAQSCPTLWDPMNCSMAGLPVHHQLPESTQTHVHSVGDAIQPSHPLLSPSPALILSQNQGLFKWVSSSHQVAKVLEFQHQHQSFQWTPRANLL